MIKTSKEKKMETKIETKCIQEGYKPKKGELHLFSYIS